MNEDPISVREIIEKNFDELQEDMERQRRLLAEVVRSCNSGCRRECLSAECPHRDALKRVVVETVLALDDTRKSFKSKRLEQLRRKLMRVLAEEG